ncbi:unnamed protein product [Parnassius mnemosyne]|uniref:LRRCT domain-containing protein n=1 Tax=Parnassius mnemosyne TaxID=213953 RepID=A0AAV1KQ00_9NEOP
MRTVFLIFTVILYSNRAQSWTFCDSVSECVCRYHDKVEEDFIREYIDCSYKKNVFDGNYTMPLKAYSLDLSSNGLKVIRSTHFLKSSTLQQLVLKNNEITEIESNAFKFPELKYLDLSYNRLEGVNGDIFKTIRKLEYLNLANNHFVSFSKLTFHPLRELKQIILDNNNIGPSLKDTNLFDRNGYGLTNKIQKISISGINLNTVHDNFFIDAYDLRQLVISNNNLTDLFEIPFTLEYLDLSDNPIKQISGEDFNDLTALKVLKLNNLSIRNIPEYAFASLHGLTKLELERNKKLTEFSVLAFGQEVLDDPVDFLLEELSLKSSRLQTLDKQLMVPFGQLIRLDLQGNFWNCDCQLIWIKNLQIKPKDYEHLRCYTPKPLYNSKIFELKAKYFKCSTKSHYVGLAIGLIAFCMFFSATALWLFWFLPKCQSRGKFISMHNPTTAYTVLPVHATT